MLAIMNSLNVHSLPIFQPILIILVSKFMVHRALSDKTYLSLGLLSPLKNEFGCEIVNHTPKSAGPVVYTLYLNLMVHVSSQLMRFVYS